ncbi:MAG: hypothetical protein Q4F97_12850 [Bacteroidales bacterium]|nr:hypothetical protein [Bacteroidales bacterium]
MGIKDGAWNPERFYKKDFYNDQKSDEKPMFLWNNNWENKPVYWEGRSIQFEYNAVNPSIQTFNTVQANCQPNFADEDDTKQSICEDDVDQIRNGGHNPHSNMFANVYVSNNNESGTFAKKLNGNIGHCSDHKKSIQILSGVIHLSVNPDYWDLKPQKWGENNLANRFVRFDPTNKTLFDKNGYLYLENNTVPGGHILNKHNGTEWENCIDGEDCEVTAFETLHLPMLLNKSNPLLFADENTVNDLKKSRYKMHFFGRSDEYSADYMAMVVQGGSTVIDTVKSTESYSYTKPKEIHDLYDIDPLSIGFWVAPQVELNRASYQDNSFGVPYPYTESHESFKEQFKSCKEKSRCYSGLASRLHYGLSDWDENYWNSLYLTKDNNGKDIVNNFVRAYLSKKSLNDVNYVIPNPVNAMDILHTVEVNSKKDYQDNRWIITPIAPTIFHNSYSGSYSPTGKLKPDVVGTSPKWQVQENPQKEGQWIIYNDGEEYKSELDYIFSRDVSQQVKRTNVDHKVSFVSILAQNKDDTTLTSTWTKNLKLSNPRLFRDYASPFL